MWLMLIQFVNRVKCIGLKQENERTNHLHFSDIMINNNNTTQDIQVQIEIQFRCWVNSLNLLHHNIRSFLA